MSAGTDPAVPVLWCLHIIGPDDVHPAPSKAHAEKAAGIFNEWIASRPNKDEFTPHIAAEVIVWPHTPESHADGVAAFIPLFLLPAWQTNPKLESPTLGAGSKAGIETAAEVLAKMRVKMNDCAGVTTRFVRDGLDRIERALSAQNGARIVAWSRTDSIRDANGYPIGTDETEVRWQSECPNPGEGWVPLYDGPHTSLSAQGEAVAGTVNGYLPRQRAVEIKLDEAVPEWMTTIPPPRAWICPHPAPARVTEEMVERAWKAATKACVVGGEYFPPTLPEEWERALTAALTAALEAGHG